MNQSFNSPTENDSCDSLLFASSLVDFHSFVSNQQQADASFFALYTNESNLESRYADSIMSCTHLVHYRCMKKMLARNDAYIDKIQGIFLCPVCRRLVSYFPLFLMPTINIPFFSRSLQSLLDQYAYAMNQEILDVQNIMICLNTRHSRV